MVEWLLGRKIRMKGATMDLASIVHPDELGLSADVVILLGLLGAAIGGWVREVRKNRKTEKVEE